MKKTNSFTLNVRTPLCKHCLGNKKFIGRIPQIGCDCGNFGQMLPPIRFLIPARVPSALFFHDVSADRCDPGQEHGTEPIIRQGFLTTFAKEGCYWHHKAGLLSELPFWLE